MKQSTNVMRLAHRAAGAMARGGLSVTKELSTRVVAGLLVAGVCAGFSLAQDGARFEITSASIAAGGETVELTFRSEAGKTYRVEGSPALGTGGESWSDTGVVASGDGGEMTVGVATAGLGNQYFFRIRSDVTTIPAGFVLIPGGTFQMGDSFGEGFSDERPVHGVHVSAFFLQAKETTKAEWDEVRTWALANGYTLEIWDVDERPDYPVHTVTWYDVVKWCNARSQKEGLAPCYYIDAARTVVYRTGQADVTNDMVDWSANGYRLPTEAEWEKAARGGLPGQRFPWGDTITHSLANYFSDAIYPYDTSPTRREHPSYYLLSSLPPTSPVGSFAPNAYGLYDMTGNVWEWCWDSFGSGYYASSPQANPLGPASGFDRVVRGGSCGDPALYGRVAVRFRVIPLGESSGLGFRPARRQ